MIKTSRTMARITPLQTFQLLVCFLTFVTLMASGCDKDKDDIPVDGDGNTYKTIVIGKQTWMAENLKTTRYNDGTAIPLVTEDATWYYLTKPGYCWYNNDESSYKNLYGAIYNWYAVNTGKLCPKGWHVPNDQEWMTLEVYLGMDATEAKILGWRGEDQKVAGKLKSTHSLWTQPNEGATNSSGFNGMPGGVRLLYGNYKYINGYAYWWCSVEADDTYGVMRSLSSELVTVFRSHYQKEYGMYIRCIKD